VIEGVDRTDLLAETVEKVVNCSVSPEEFRKALIQVFYTIGIVGLKLAGYDPVLWSFAGGRRVDINEIRADTRLYLHPAAWRGLAIVYRQRNSGRQASL
jgi:hypothetical protein